jgi:hypothetical protein
MGTDEDLRAGMCGIQRGMTNPDIFFSIDPTFFRDPSGCTAVAALFTKDRKIYVVSIANRYSSAVLFIDPGERW